MKNRSCFIFALFLTIFSTYAQRDTIRSVNDVPRFTYNINDIASVIYKDNDQFRKLYLEVQNN